MKMQSHLGRARNLGASRSGVGPWWIQRLTSIALIPLSLWFIFSVVGLLGVDYAGYQQWIGNVGNATLMCLFIVIVFHHAQQGVCEVIHDYVHAKMKLYTGFILVKFTAAILAVACLISVLKVAFGG
jgi:succinate dehydrogenase membrane anchor subunit